MWSVNALVLYIMSLFFVGVDIATIKGGGEAKPRKAKIGMLIPNTVIQFEKAENSSLNLVGKAKG